MRLFGKKPKAVKARFSLPRWIMARFDAAQTTKDNARHWSAAEFLSADAEADSKHGEHGNEGGRAGLQDQGADAHGETYDRSDRKVNVSACQDAQQHACRKHENVTVLGDQVVDILGKQDLAARAD